MKTTDFQVYVPVDEGYLKHPATGRDVPHPGHYEWFQITWTSWAETVEGAADGSRETSIQTYPVVNWPYDTRG